MKKEKFLLKSVVPVLLVVTVVLSSCSGTKTIDADSKHVNDVEDFRNLQKIVKDKNFTVTSDWAYPLGGSRVNLIGNPNFVTFEKDSVKTFLPYFGVVQVVANYGGGGGISFEGVPKSYKVIPLKNKNNVLIKFDISNKTENFEVLVTLFPNKSARISVNSGYRNSISYSGRFEGNKKEEDSR